MAQITAAMVNELRQLTQAPMMQCKKALQEADGDIQLAIENMRKAGIAKAAKKAGRVAAEGTVGTHIESGYGVIAEINCETDFVARDDNFLAFAATVMKTAAEHKITDPAKLAETKLTSGETLEQVRLEAINKLGENIQIRRVASLDSSGHIAEYSHHGRIGVLVALDKDDMELGRDIAMHIAASNPVALSADQVPAELIAKEREIAQAQAEESGKPKEIIEKMVDGRIKKYVKEVALLDQPFVKNPDHTVAQLLKQKAAQIEAYIRFEVGEGIEKPVEDFAQAVREQIS